MRRWQRDRIRRGENPAADWRRDAETVIHGRHVARGTELSIRGERGRFRFYEQVTKPDGTTWLSVIGGPSGCIQWRAFRPERVRTVHRKKRTITAAEAVERQRAKRAERKASS